MISEWKWKLLSCVWIFVTHGKYSPWKSLGQNTGVGSLSLLQGIFPTQGSNPGLPHCRRILYQLNPQVCLILTLNFKLNILNTEGIFNFNFQWFFHINIKNFDTSISVWERIISFCLILKSVLSSLFIFKRVMSTQKNVKRKRKK